MPLRQRLATRYVGVLGDVMRNLFLRHLRVRRVAGSLSVVFEDERDGPAIEARVTATSSADSRDLARGELTALLDAAPGSRKLLRYLTAVEHGLLRKDPTGMFLFEVVPDRLHSALRQLDGLAPHKPSAGLLALRARIVDAIAAHAQQDKRREMLMPRSELMLGDRMAVGDARASDFDKAAAQWRPKKPAK